VGRLAGPVSDGDRAENVVVFGRSESPFTSQTYAVTALTSRRLGPSGHLPPRRQITGRLSPSVAGRSLVNKPSRHGTARRAGAKPRQFSFVKLPLLKPMLGIGTIVLILVIVLVVLMLRRRV
jgi:hypothetical protein